jgi:hypothetical protein
MKRRRVLAEHIVAMVVGGLLLTGCGGSGGDPVVQAQSSGVIDLSGVPPNWDKALPAASRFVVLAAFNNDAVRDNETGLVWERSPQTIEVPWGFARTTCINKNVGGRRGWRLPSIPELASLVDPSVASPGPTLPAGHPFANVQSAQYWSASTNSEFPTGAWFVHFFSGFVGGTDKTLNNQVWCVRGDMHADQY